MMTIVSLMVDGISNMCKTKIALNMTGQFLTVTALMVLPFLKMFTDKD